MQPFESVDDLVNRTGINKKALDVLANCGALASIAGDRHRARWMSKGHQKLTGLLAETSVPQDPVMLRASTEGEDIVGDYNSVGLTLGRHPLAVIRPRLDACRITASKDLKLQANGSKVRVAGMVTHRQRPGTASGVMFISLEDEFGMTNLIVWPSVQEEQRREVLAARLMVVVGSLQNEDNVVHVIAQRVHDRTRWLGALRSESRDFH